MKEILSQLVWFGVTSTILILIFRANNIENGYQSQLQK